MVLVGGLRVERTETTYRGNESLFDESGATSPRSRWKRGTTT
jgi:hypothetical protein